MQQELDVPARRILQMNLAISCYTQYLRNFFIILPVRGKYQQNIEIHTILLYIRISNLPKNNAKVAYFSNWKIITLELQPRNRGSKHVAITIEMISAGILMAILTE